MRRERSALRGCSRRCAEPGSLSGDGPGERGWRWSSASGPAPEDRGRLGAGRGLGIGTGTGTGIAARAPAPRAGGAAPGRALGPSPAGPLGPGLCRGPAGAERRRFPRADAEPGLGPAGARGHAGPAPGPPDPAGPAALPAPPATSELPRSGTPEATAALPGRTSPACPFPAAPAGSRPQCPPGTRALGPTGAPAAGSLQPRGPGVVPGQGKTRAALSSFLPCSGTPSRAACLSPCPWVCPQAAPGAGTDRAAGRAQAAPSSACGTSAIAYSSSLPSHPEGAAHLTPARRGRSCLGGKRLQERKPRNAPTGRCRASQRTEGPQGNRVRKGAFIQSLQLSLLCTSPSQPRAAGSAAGWAVPGWGRAPIHHCPAQGGVPAPSGIHPAAAKVLVRRPSSFPGIKEPNESGGIPRSEAKASVECRCLVPPAGGRLLQVNSTQASPSFPIQAGSARALGTVGSGWAGTESRTRGRVDQLPREPPGDEATGSSFQSREHILSLAEAGSQSRSLLARLGGSSWIHSGGKPLCLPGALTLFVLQVPDQCQGHGEGFGILRNPKSYHRIQSKEESHSCHKKLKNLLKILGQQYWDSQDPY
ncbi:collagen alpha-1(I) chain-like isoform X1 [Pipra filicauda]|uniref:Collagen alpha-1(I) chain-like isoform X1 n=1 Tax=Pipra filicauda TaxID=649802 RepID=A0A7R5KVY6_9PASS|nr:collagen alpha-1(I) chain-like isoform X1 [Pipra filicauda]